MHPPDLSQQQPSERARCQRRDGHQLASSCARRPATTPRSSSGDAGVTTGNAYAAANVLNLVNTNIVNSSYLLLSFNNFGDLSQDITLPSDGFFSAALRARRRTAESELEHLYRGRRQYCNDDRLGHRRSRDRRQHSLEHRGDLDAKRPAPETSPRATRYSSANTFTQENTNNIGGTSVFMLFRIVAGTWTGFRHRSSAGNNGGDLDRRQR